MDTMLDSVIGLGNTQLVTEEFDAKSFVNCVNTPNGIHIPIQCLEGAEQPQ